MKRFARLLTLSLFAAALFLLQGSLTAQTKVEYHKTEVKTDTVTGEIKEESPAGLKLKVSKADVVIPGKDIIRITYEVPVTLKLDIQAALTAEDKREFDKAVASYKSVLDKVRDDQKSLKTYVEYRICVLKTQLAETEGNKFKDAMDTCAKFLEENKTSWEYPLIAKSLSRMQMDRGDAEGAVKTLENLVKVVPKEMRTDADLALIDALFEAKKFAEAATKIDAIQPTVTAKAPLEKLKLFKVGVKVRNAGTNVDSLATEIEAMISQNRANNGFVGTAYNVLGDVYSASDRKRDAMWSYLWVDTVYNQDRVEQIKAAERLAKLFDSEPLKDEAKAKYYRDKLGRLR